jgi:hypothetical protein
LPLLQSPSAAHVVLHAVAPQAYAPQDCVARAGQEPVPAQLAAIVSTPPLQDGARHCVEAPGYAQALPSVPLHVPPQAEPSVVHAARAPCGAPATAVQTPWSPETSHAWHWPLHAVSQQYPSAQCPVPHSPSVVHVLPCSLLNAAATVCAEVTFGTM